MKRLTIGILCAFTTAAASAQAADNDSIKTTNLNEVVIESNNQRLGAEMSTYIPTAKQKNASQTPGDLLNRMAIPQLRISPGDQIKDLTGKDIDIFIDFLPASKEDLEGMRMLDVKKVEYYVFPSDPRFQGKPRVVNFVMQKYEYGGYVKSFGWGISTNAGQLSLYSKLQYKRMTFDLAVGAFHVNQKHYGSDISETFRLPQPDGTLNTFMRHSLQDDGQQRKRTYWPTLKALYSSDKITMQNTIGANFNNDHTYNMMGHIFYQPEVDAPTEYWQREASRVNFVSYTGFWNFILNDNNSITFSPSYAYSHTRTSSLYAEAGSDQYFNAATDNSHRAGGDITYNHSFGDWGNINAMVMAVITKSDTHYTGTANQSDNAAIYRLGPGAQYSLSKGNIYGTIDIGLHWDRQEYVNFKKNSVSPWIDLSLQYSPNDRHSASVDFHHCNVTPSASDRSAAVIQSNKLMSYTGNPNLVSYRSYDVSADYSFIPSSRLSFSFFGWGCVINNRFVYDYEPTATGILRTIKQPGGGYSKWDYGATATWRLFDKRLQLTAQLNAVSVHNGAPFNHGFTDFVYAFQANYYINNFSFSGIYYSPQRIPSATNEDAWMKTKTYYMLKAGWGNASWNLQLHIFNFARWNWLSDKKETRSRYYDKTEQTTSINDHASVRLSVTYTFGFGKKIERGNEASQQSGISSGILK